MEDEIEMAGRRERWKTQMQRLEAQARKEKQAHGSRSAVDMDMLCLRPFEGQVRRLPCSAKNKGFDLGVAQRESPKVEGLPSEA